MTMKMKRLLTTIIIVLGVLCGATSCLQNETDSTLLYGYTAIGNMQDGVFVSDYNQKFHILIKDCTGSLDTCSRVVIYCDILQQLDQVGLEYNIRLRGFASPVMSNPVPASKAAGVGNDPVDMNQGWVSGGYLNLYVRYPYLASSGVNHTLNLVYDDTRSGSDTLYFSLKHNAFEETLLSGKYTMSELSLYHTYASFPISQYMPAGKSEVVVVLDWDWYNSDDAGNVIDSTVIHHEDSTKYTLN